MKYDDKESDYNKESSSNQTSLSHLLLVGESVTGGPNTYASADVAVGSKIYCFGGYDETKSSVTDTIDVLDTTTKKWSSLTKLPINTQVMGGVKFQWYYLSFWWSNI